MSHAAEPIEIPGHPIPTPAGAHLSDYALRLGDELSRRLAPYADVSFFEVTVTPSDDPDIRVPAGLEIVIPADSPLGFHKITYDQTRQWGYCSAQNADPASCWIPLPEAPTDEVLDAAAEWVVYTPPARRARPVGAAPVVGGG
jgi:hypothetical protein